MIQIFPYIALGAVWIALGAVFALGAVWMRPP